MCRDCFPAGTGDLLSRRDLLIRASALAATVVTPLWSEWFDLAAARAAGSRRTDVICKEAWGAEPAKGKFSRHTVRRLTVHHSGAVVRRNRRAPDQLRSFQRYHQSQGWPDIAYHFIVDRHGNIYKGRPTWARPDTFTDYNPRGHLTVMCLGSFSEQPIPAAQVASVRDVLAWAVREFEVPIHKIRGHRDYTPTACPGNDLYRLIESGRLRRAVRRRLHQGNVELGRLCGAKGHRYVRAIERGDD
jgi:hypothetical protein